jgi:CMP-N,N'-diacetyllegionaminic acid synthase
MGSQPVSFERPQVVAIILARGGSKGIPNKNLISICGKPLMVWSIMQACMATSIDKVFVSSESDEILSVAMQYGATPIRRPESLAGDTASSESAWLHALDEIEHAGTKADFIVGMQATSPIRAFSDLDSAITQMKQDNLDSLLSVVEVEDFFNWRVGQSGPESIDYDYQSRKRRQDIGTRYLENGSFYIFRPEILRNCSNRLGGKIGMQIMERHKMFQIDNLEDVTLCEIIMHGYGLDKI